MDTATMSGRSMRWSGAVNSFDCNQSGSLFDAGTAEEAYEGQVEKKVAA